MSSVTYTATAGQTTFAVPFPFLSSSHLVVFVAGSATTAWTLSGSSVVLDSGASLGAQVVIERSTPSSALLGTFTDGSTLRASEILRVATQLLYIFQEATAAAEATMRKNVAGTQWDAETLPIERVGNPISDTSATNKAWVLSALAASGALPEIDLNDVGKGLLVRNVGGDAVYGLGSIDTATTILRIPKGPAGSDGRLFGQEIARKGLIGDQWNTPAGADTDLPLEIQTTLGTPVFGAVTLSSGDRFTLPAGGKYLIEVQGSARSLTSTNTTGHVNFCAALTSVDGATIHDQFYVRALGMAGGTGSATDPGWNVNGSPQSAFQASAPIQLLAVVDTSAGAQTLQLRASAGAVPSEPTIFDYPTRIIIKEITV